MIAPWNFGSACLGGRNDRISMECLNLVHQGGVIPLGVGDSLRRYPIKLHQLTMRVELFFFSYPVGLKAYFTGAEIISQGHPMGRGVREYKGGSRFALIYMD